MGNEVIIYTDGACSGNPGPGGWAAILMPESRPPTELSGGYQRTTNNRMELMAVIRGLESLPPGSEVTVRSDSTYVVNGITKGWAAKWQKNGWMRNAKDPAINPDLWEQLLKLCVKHKVKLEWVRGHSKDPLNNRADELAVAAIRYPGSDIDVGYKR